MLLFARQEFCYHRLYWYFFRALNAMEASVPRLPLVILSILFLASAPSSASAQGSPVVIGYDTSGQPICTGPLGPGPCALVLEYMRQQMGAQAPITAPGGSAAPGQSQPPNSFQRNPGQIFGGPNSVFNNPGQILGGGGSRIVEQKPWGFCQPNC
jgi:hypothetical protein